MEIIQDKYPIFEANQVLTNAHLNEVFAYLDEQERLTRANLIGIGIVCGLEIRLDAAAGAATLPLSKGCGVTSQGYLIVEPEDVDLVSYRDYTLPDDLDYPPFKDKSADPKVQYPLWELFPAGEPGTDPLGTPPHFLDDKAVVLFLELKKEGLRNCSPDNCDDRGAEVRATVRRLLIRSGDLDKVIAEANQLGTGLSSGDLAGALLSRMNLPDLRLGRYDVPSTGPVTSEEVLAAFQAVFQSDKLASQTGDALTAAYNAFKPLLAGAFPSNPFANFGAAFGFLDDVPTSTAQVRFLQYYWDFFDDLLRAYDEFRWSGSDLLCACCPPEGLFPRHLMLGLLAPASVNNAGIYRQPFIASPAVGGCEGRAGDLLFLFRRLVAMIDRFTNTPPLPQASGLSIIFRADPQIRITPSLWGDAPLSDKAIPYYYRQDGMPPLYQLWDPEKTSRNRANQNLSYRADEYVPPAPAFVTDPLRYDLEPHNFLRVEGHLGKNVGSALNTLLALKARFRLPVEVIALRTGAFDEKMEVDLSKEDCRFQDLETLYDALKGELTCFLCKEVQYIYGLPFASNSTGTGASTQPPAKATLPLLVRCAPDFLVQPGTVGRLIEDVLSTQRGPVAVGLGNLAGLRATSFASIFVPGIGINISPFLYLYYLAITMSALSDLLTPDLRQLDFETFEKRYQDLERLAAQFESAREQTADAVQGSAALLSWDELDDRLEDILFRCRLDPFRALEEEYKRRVREVKQKQFLSFCLQKNPGIQHKAGAPLGGTFILVYHVTPDVIRPRPDVAAPGSVVSAGLPGFTGFTSLTTGCLSETTRKALSGALSRLQSKGAIVDDPDIQLVFAELTGQIPVRRPTPQTEADKIYSAAVGELADGTVIADFFLPYLCCSDCAPIQYVLPAPPLGVRVEVGCANAGNHAEVTVTPQAASGKVSFQLDGGPFQELTGKLLVPAGTHTLVIRDDTGAQSAPRTFTVPGRLTLGDPSFIDDMQAKTYQVSFDISGGTAPYTADPGAISGNTYTSPPVQSGDKLDVKVADAAGCTATASFEHTVSDCDLPCGGKAVRCGYRFWIPEPGPDRPYKSYKAEVSSFKIEFPQGGSVDLSAEVVDIIQSPNDELNNHFGDVVEAWLGRITELVASKTGSTDWLRLDYTKSPFEANGTLFIEHFECLVFEFSIRAFFQRPNSPEDLVVDYKPEGTTVRNVADGSETFIPAFNCAEIDRCNPQLAASDPCSRVDLTLRISKRVTPNGVTLNATPSGGDRPATYLWEVEDGIPALSNERRAEFRFERREPAVKRIRLTAFTEKGCRVTVEDTIDLSNP